MSKKKEEDNNRSAVTEHILRLGTIFCRAHINYNCTVHCNALFDNDQKLLSNV